LPRASPSRENVLTLSQSLQPRHEYSPPLLKGGRGDFCRHSGNLNRRHCCADNAGLRVLWVGAVLQEYAGPTVRRQVRQSAEIPLSPPLPKGEKTALPLRAALPSRCQGPLLAGRTFLLSAKASNQGTNIPPFVKGGEGGFLQTLGQSEPMTLLCRQRRAPCFVGGRRASGICRSNGPEAGAPVRSEGGGREARKCLRANSESEGLSRF